MATRLLDEAWPSNVIPLRPKLSTVVIEADTPEPAQLYNLIVLAFLLHTPKPDDRCVGCGHDWPCREVRLAFRLREGF